MEISQHILTDLPVFEISDSLQEVYHFFSHHPYSHVAIVEKDSFLGVLGDHYLDEFKGDGKIEDLRYDLEAFFVLKSTGWLDVLECFARNEANLMPVLDLEEKVLGYYDIKDVVGEFIDTPFFTEPGGILVVEKGIKDYSFSEVAQIVESNNGRLIGAFITQLENDMVQLTLKIGVSNINEITQTFRRYHYSVIFGNNDDQFLEDLKQRSDYLDKYLNV